MQIKQGVPISESQINQALLYYHPPGHIKICLNAYGYHGHELQIKIQLASLLCQIKHGLLYYCINN